MKNYREGLLIGRFQPFHKGHLYLLKHVQKKVKKLVIGIGSANVFDEDNPFTYEERKEMIEKVIDQEKLGTFIEKIVPLIDIYDDQLWFKNTLKNSGNIDVVIGNNEWPNRIFEDRGYKIWRVGFFKKYLYEGAKIRRLIYQKKHWHNRVPEYLVSSIENHLKRHKTIPYRFQHIVIGGTFDHFHRGHEKLIDTSLRYGNALSIGVTTQSMYSEKEYTESIEDYAVRKKSLIAYLKKKKSLQRAVFFPLSDIYGSTKTDGTIEAIVVSKMTYLNAIKINKLRKKRKLPELKIIRIEEINGDDEKLISSVRIRRGEIDRNGYTYAKVFKTKRILPGHLREKLRRPLGKVIRGKENELGKTVHKVIKFIKLIKPVMVIAVGDIIANSLEKIGFTPDVKIIDYRSRRQAIKKPKKLEKGFVNKPGTISKESALAIKNAIHANFEPVHPKGGQPQKIIIDGEEDLLALPAILFAPLGSVVLYGQIDLGVVMVKVTEKEKEKIKNILKKFK